MMMVDMIEESIGINGRFNRFRFDDHKALLLLGIIMVVVQFELIETIIG